MKKLMMMIAAAVEDVRRFPEASKLAAYCGFSPIVDTSGNEEEAASASKASSGFSFRATIIPETL